MSAIYNAIANNALLSPDKPAIVLTDNTSITYRELITAIQQVVCNLTSGLSKNVSYNLDPSRRVDNPPLILLAKDGLDSIVTILAINYLGLTLAPMNAAMGTGPLSKGRDSIAAACILHDDYYALKAEELSSETCKKIDIQSLFNDSSVRVPPPVSSDDFAYLLTLSSGSTGDPKPVIYSDRGKLQRALFTANEFDFSVNDVILCASPFFHSLGQRLTFMPLILGATMVQLPRFSVNAWLDLVHQHKVSVTICVSSHLFALKDALVEQDPRITSIRALVSSSASIDNATKTALFDNGRFDFFEMYGASEVATATRLSSTDPVEKRDSVGIACQGVAVKIMVDDDHEARPDQSGEIWVKSPLCSPGYYLREDLSQKAFTNSWFRTGDLGYLDEDGFLYFVDRSADVIVSGGSNLYPSDIEHCLREDPQVKDCIVLGVNDSYLGEAAIAVVVSQLKPAGALEKKLRQRVRKSLAPSQQPLLYFIVDALPLNGAGKIDRKALREHYNNMGLDPSSRFRQILQSKASA